MIGRGAGWGRIHRHLCGGGEKGLPLVRGRCGWGPCLTHCSVRWRQKPFHRNSCEPYQGPGNTADHGDLGLGDKNHPFFPGAVMG